MKVNAASRNPIRFWLVALLFAGALTSAGILPGSRKAVHSQSGADFAFLNAMGLPWRCEDTEPRMVTKDWNGHWANGSATGAAIDFNFDGPGDNDKDVLAPFSGTATTEDVWGYGRSVIIDAGNGWSVRISHLLAFLVSSGESVQKGQVVARSDNSTGGCGFGCSTGPHIHFELYWNGASPNPSWFNTSGNFLFSLPTDDLLSWAGTQLYSNNCGQGPATTLYWDIDWHGLQTHYFGYGNFRVPAWFNDRASSLDLADGAAGVTLYEHADQTGGSIYYLADRPDFTLDQFNNGLGVNDQTSALRVDERMVNFDMFAFLPAVLK